MRRYYLITTEHLERALWFRDEEDFRVAMNLVAIQTVKYPFVRVLAFILMSNHVHFFMKGLSEEVTSFIHRFKLCYSMYYKKKYGVKAFLKRNKVDVKEIPYADEAPERVIAYIHMNSVAASICLHPSQYPWGTGNVFFSTSPSGGRPVAAMKQRPLKRLIHSDFSGIPDDWIVSDSGYILPRCYVDVAAVEALFRSPGRMNYFCNSSSKAHKRIETGEGNLPAFRDQTILAALPDLLRSLFQKRSFQELTIVEQTEFLRQLRFRFSTDVNQLARVCGLSYAEAAERLDCR